MFEVAAERGAGNVTVAHVVERSGVSRRTFYELFEDRDDCFHVAFEDAVSYAAERVLPAYAAENGWEDRIGAALAVLLSFLDDEPVIARLLIVESHSGGPATQRSRARILAALTSAVEEGRDQAKGSSPPPLAGEGVIGGVLTVIHSRLVEGGYGPLLQLRNSLMSMIVLPYLGGAAAKREFERSTPTQAPARGTAPLLSDPFKGAGMRLTYRTVRTLMAIGEHPGASNRLVAEAAEIRDQGQVSKLLGRLERIGMVTNAGLGPGQGAPNAWTLTAGGRRVVNSIRAHTEALAPERGSDERPMRLEGQASA